MKNLSLAVNSNATLLVPDPLHQPKRADCAEQFYEIFKNLGFELQRAGPETY